MVKIKKLKKRDGMKIIAFAVLFIGFSCWSALIQASAACRNPFGNTGYIPQPFKITPKVWTDAQEDQEFIERCLAREQQSQQQAALVATLAANSCKSCTPSHSSNDDICAATDNGIRSPLSPLSLNNNAGA